MPDSLRKRILSERDTHEADPTFSDRLLEGVARIEAEFEGAERDRLLAMVAETLDRHLEIRRSHEATRVALGKLRANQQRLADLLRALVARPSPPTLH